MQQFDFQGLDMNSWVGNSKVVKSKSLKEGETLVMVETSVEGRPIFYTIYRTDANHIMIGNMETTKDRAFAEIIFKDKLV